MGHKKQADKKFFAIAHFKFAPAIFITETGNNNSTEKNVP